MRDEPTKDIAAQLLDRLGLDPDQYRAIYESIPLMQRDSLDAALAEAVAALPYKRWTLTLEGDWEDGWVAAASSRLAGGPGIEVSTAGRGWGAARGGLPTPLAALRALAAKLREVGR